MSQRPKQITPFPSGVREPKRYGRPLRIIALVIVAWLGGCVDLNSM